MCKRVLFFLFSLIFSLPIMAQNLGVVKVKVLNENKEPIDFVTLMLSPEDTTKAKFYVVSDAKGNGVLEKIPYGKYTLSSQLMGYKTVETALIVDKGEIELDPITMAEDIDMLEQAVITDIGNPIIVKKDTIEYNANAYKITDNDMLEELLKKLPGLEISESGAITVNGKSVTKIRIDGKEFFSDDPKVAMSNIPAKLIEKIKVIDEKSEQAQFTGIDDGEEETIIDLGVKPGMVDGWFGNIATGGGFDIDEENDPRFGGSAIVGKFGENSQLSFIASGNNTNERGFSGMGMRGGGGVGSGITTSWLGGTNASVDLFDDMLKLQGNYMFSGSENNADEKSLRNTFINDFETLTREEENVSYDLDNGHRAGGRVDYKISDKTSILFRPNFSYNLGEYSEGSIFSTSNSLSGMVNEGTTSTYGTTDSWSARGSLLFRQRIGETAGRTFSANFDYNLSENLSDEINKSTTTEFSNNLEIGERTIDQNIINTSESYSLGSRFTYTEPLGRNFYMEGSYEYRYAKTISDKSSYLYNIDTDAYDIFDNNYSSSYENVFINQRAEIQLVKQEEKYNLQFGFGLHPSTTISTEKLFKEGRDSVLNYSVLNFAPSARFDYKFSDTHNLYLRYSGRTSQPNITQLQPVPNNTNPTYVRLGNPSLQPSFSNNLTTNYRLSSKETFSSLNLRLSLGYVKDAIINASWYNSSGVQYTAPINSEAGTYTSNLNLTYNTPIAKSGFSVSSTTSLNLSSGMSYTGEGDYDNIDDIIEDLISGRTTNISLTENLRFMYRADNFSASLGGRARYSDAWYSIQSQEKPSTWTNSITSDITTTLPWGMDFKTDASYNFYIGYEDGFNENIFLWNAQVSQLIFKGKATLSMKLYDILNQQRSISRITTDNYIEDVQRSTLGRYVMFSLTFRFGKYTAPSRGNRHSGGGGGKGGMR